MEWLVKNKREIERRKFYVNRRTNRERSSKA